MAKKKSKRVFVADFETTVYKGQAFTEVWAAAIVELFKDDVQIYNSIDSFMKYVYSLSTTDDLIIYFHNLKFDGMFIISYLMAGCHMEQAVDLDENGNVIDFLSPGDMKNNTFRYSIADRMGQWYTLTIKQHGHVIEFRDSLKLLPFKVATMAKAFATSTPKLKLHYEGKRKAGGVITEDEKAYISADVIVVKESLEYMYKEGHDKLTIGSCCLAEFKDGFRYNEYKGLFPNVYEIKIKKAVLGADSVGAYIRRAYRGGWCYLVPEKAGKVLQNGTVADVNSEYPFVMLSESGNRYPVGEPKIWNGNFIPPQALAPDSYYYIRIRTRFKLKPGMLPFMQIKGSMLYKSTEMLTTSDWRDEKTGNYYRYYTHPRTGERMDTLRDYVLTMTDFELLKKHYDLPQFEILDGMYFRAERGLFDTYLLKYRAIKETSKGARRTSAKLFSNNLYGKEAANEDSSFKVAVLSDDGVVKFYGVPQFDKQPGYIPIGAAITSYARAYIITAAQANYHGPDKPGFVYCDTDSLHLDIPPDKIVGVRQHPTEYGAFKFESCWDKAVFARQKTYIEHVIMEDLQPCKPHYEVRCAGMPEKCKQLLIRSILGLHKTARGPHPVKAAYVDGTFKPEDRQFILGRRSMESLRRGLRVPGKLYSKHIPGGTVLYEDYYEMR